MTNHIDLAELQRGWTPPDGLDRGRPRPVRLSGGRALLAVSLALFAGGFAAGIHLGITAVRQAEGPGKPISIWIPCLVFVLLEAFGGLILIPLLRQRRLLADGRPALGLVTGLSKTYRTSHGHKLGNKVYYEFPLLSGAIATGASEPMKTPPAVGSTICVLYDPENPRRNSPYPLSLVKKQ